MLPCQSYFPFEVYSFFLSILYKIAMLHIVNHACLLYQHLNTEFIPATELGPENK